MKNTVFCEAIFQIAIGLFSYQSRIMPNWDSSTSTNLVLSFEKWKMTHSFRRKVGNRISSRSTFCRRRHLTAVTWAAWGTRGRWSWTCSSGPTRPPAPPRSFRWPRWVSRPPWCCPLPVCVRSGKANTRLKCNDKHFWEAGLLPSFPKKMPFVELAWCLQCQSQEGTFL